MIVYDRFGHSLELGAALFEGGEGVIYAVNHLPRQLAKIYKADKRTYKETKLAWMTANPPLPPTRCTGQVTIAWPESLLYGNRRDFIGYLMPRIPNAKTLLHVFNPRLRSQILPAFDQRSLYCTARNLAAALRAVHAQDYVIGDLNDANVLVDPSAQVSVIDVDSFQVKEKRAGQLTFYPCPVGRLEYTPPELQGRYYPSEVRQPEQDAFALGVLIFQLLMDGNHPFRSIWLGKGDPPPVEERIIRGWFPYNQQSRNLVKPPPGMSLEHLHPALAALMVRCFVDGQGNPRRRPSAAEWENALAQAEKGLTTCQCGAIFPAHRDRCPCCAAHPPEILVACPACGVANPDRRVYCSKCASRLHPLAACPHCGQLTAQGVQAKYCESCGLRL